MSRLRLFAFAALFTLTSFAVATAQSEKSQSKAAQKADKNLILVGCLAPGPQANTYVLTTDGSNGVEAGQRVHLIGGDKGTLEEQVGQKVQVSGQIDARGAALKTVAKAAAVAAPLAGAVATGGVSVAAGVAAGEVVKNKSESRSKNQDARSAALPRFSVIAVKSLEEECASSPSLLER